MNNYQPISALGWIDFSDTDKQKVMKVIEMLQPDGTVDELGVGVIRNALSDAMFPGITTIMTRAKYFFIVPQILNSYILNKSNRITAREYLDQEEEEIMHILSKQNDYNDNLGIIGITVAKQNQFLSRNRWKKLIRKPSTIYWNGIRMYKINNTELSLSNLLDTINKKLIAGTTKSYQAAEGETPDDRDAEKNEKNIFSFPDYDKNWKENISIDLTQNEANFLKHRIIDNYGDNLVAEILKDEVYTKDFLKAESFLTMCDMPFIESITIGNKAIILTAKDFWHIMYGAHIRYNIILHKRHGSEQVEKTCNELWNNWVSEMECFDWSTFNRELMWSITKDHSSMKSFTKNFINNWMDRIEKKEFDIGWLDKLVEDQESKNKTSRSKLRLQNDDKYDKWVGISNMDFRFRNAKIIIRDIVSPI